MNKYEKSLDYLRTLERAERLRIANDVSPQLSCDILQELVNKSKPKKLNSLYYKVYKKYDEYYVLGYCTVCGNEFNISKNNRPNYCPHCGQKIDWGEKKDCDDCSSRLKT